MATAQAAEAETKAFAKVDEIFADYALDNHIPGLVYGVVADGKLVYVRGIGVQDLESKRPVTADTLFRIASMTKAFTALTVLKLRDEGKLQLDALAETYVAGNARLEIPDAGLAAHSRARPAEPHRGLCDRRPVGRSPDAAARSRVLQAAARRRAFHTSAGHGAGSTRTSVTPCSAGSSPMCPGIRTRTPSRRRLLKPLGMESSGFVVDAAPRERRALGYRWEDDAWRLEPTMAHGAFGAMGGIQTSANDYARWVAYLLSAWPPRDDADAGPVKPRHRARARDKARAFRAASRSGSDIRAKAPARSRPVTAWVSCVSRSVATSASR